jgi:hypothetical protein
MMNVVGVIKKFLGLDTRKKERKQERKKKLYHAY